MRLVLGTFRKQGLVLNNYGLVMKHLNENPMTGLSTIGLVEIETGSFLVSKRTDIFIIRQVIRFQKINCHND